MREHQSGHHVSTRWLVFLCFPIGVLVRGHAFDALFHAGPRLVMELAFVPAEHSIPSVGMGLPTGRVGTRDRKSVV